MNISMDNPDKNTKQTDLTQPQGISVTLGGKEQAPMAPFMSSSEAQPSVEGLKEFGVNAIQDRPQVSPDLAEAGVFHAGPTIPPPTKLSSIELSSEERVIAQKASVYDSIKGLLSLIVKKEKRQGGIA